MKNRLTKFFTVFLAVMLCVGMSPATSTAYAASWNSGSVASFDFGNWLKNLIGGSNKNDSSDKENKNDASLDKNQSNDAIGEQTTDPDAGGKLNLSKSISKNEDGTYTINLEAYATGKVDVSTTESYKPTDIVLVLDQSASMLDGFSTSSETTYINYTGKTNKELYRNKDNLYVLENEEYIKVEVKRNWISEGWFSGYYEYTYSYNGNSESSEKEDSEGPNLPFYLEQTIQTTTTKEEALETAVTQFVNQIQATAKEHTVDYRVAIVGYGSYEGSNYKNTELLTTPNVVNYRNAKDSDYRNALVSVNDNGSLNSRISNAIKNIVVEKNTATSADLGMDMAQKVLANNSSTAEERNKVVVMFTDGEPNHSNGFSTTVANTTIGTSKTIKSTYNANVFTVGILQNANPDDTTSNINKYMNYVSSNYPNASDLDHGGSGSNQGYYMNAKNASQLNSIFQKISSSIETPSTSVTLNGQSVLKDVISDNFTLPDNFKTSDIKVYTAPFAGKNGDKYNWGEKQPFNATVSIDGNTVNVSGFDYSSNYAVTTSNGNRGNKLIVQIPVNIVRTFGGNKIPSNENTSGIYDKGSMVQAFEVPTVDAPIDYEVAGKDEWINAGEEVSLAKLVGSASDGDFEYKADGKKNKFVDLIYTIKDESGKVVGTYTIEAGKTASDAVGTTGKLDVDTTYTVECTVKPITDGTTKETTVESAISHVYIYGVAKAFVIDFAKPITYKATDVFTKNELKDKSGISIESGTNTYGTLTMDNEKSITYKLNKFMDGIDTYTFNVACKSATKTVKMVPASSVYYEDNFGEETDADGNVTTKSIIDYDDNWTTVKDGNVVTSINGDDPVGYDSAYEGNTKFSSGSAHMVEAGNKIVTATFTFQGSGIDLYGYTNKNTGRMLIELYELDKDGNASNRATYSALVDTKYNSGEVFQTPLFSYMGTKNAKYKVVVTVPKKSSIYLDALRVYYPIGTSNENYKDDEKNIQYVDIRDQIFDPVYFSVSGKLFVDEHADGHNTKPAHIIDLSKADDKAEYSTYGRKREVAIAPGGTVTLSGFKEGISVKQIGMRTNAVAPDEFKLENANGKVDVNGKEINLNSATDMYYNVTVKDGKLVITNNTNYIITLTNLKLK